jgi:hypothetical protein
MLVVRPAPLLAALAVVATALAPHPHASARVVPPGGTAVLRLLSIDDQCDRGAPVVVDAQVVRVLRGHVRRRAIRVALRCADRAAVAPGRLLRARLDLPTVPEARHPDFVATPDGEVTTADLPGVDPRSVLDTTRREIERTHPDASATDADGFVWYRDGLAVRYDAHDVAVEMLLTIPPGLGCDDVPAWLGLPRAGGPLRRRDGCEWPGLSDRHRLAPGVSAVLRGGVLRVTRGSLGSP